MSPTPTPREREKRQRECVCVRERGVGWGEGERVRVFLCVCVCVWQSKRRLKDIRLNFCSSLFCFVQVRRTRQEEQGDDSQDAESNE